MARPDELTFAPLGGVGEIGMNLSIYGLGNRHQRSWLAVDLGVSFGDEEHLPGIDLIMPDIRFLEKERNNLMGLVLTHAHEDHFGAIIDLWPKLQCRIYATKFSAALFEAKCAAERNAPKIPVTVVPSGGRIDLGPFSVEFIPVAHSIPESHALAIHTSAGTVAAYRRLEDRSDADHRLADRRAPAARIGRCRRAGAGRRFHQRGSRRPLALGSRSRKNDQGIGEGGKGPGRGHHLRLQRRAPEGGGGRRESSRPRGGRGRPRHGAGGAGRARMRLSRWRRRISAAPTFTAISRPDKVLALCTGSQGEPRAALARIANDDHPQVTLNKGDTVIFSSRTIPGNEKAVGGIINGLVIQGVEVITDRDHLVHVSGHPRRDELRDMISWVRPQLLIPVHGEALHLHEHAKLARAAGVPKVLTCRNGDLVKLGPGDPGIIDQLPSGRLYKDGTILEDSKSRAVVERRRMGFAGCAFIAIAMTDKGELVDDPEVDLVGMPEKNTAGEELDEIVFDVVVSTVEGLPRARRRDADATAESVRRAVRAVLNEHWGKKPICIVHVLTV